MMEGFVPMEHTNAPVTVVIWLRHSHRIATPQCVHAPKSLENVNQPEIPQYDETNPKRLFPLTHSNIHSTHRTHCICGDETTG